VAGRPSTSSWCWRSRVSWYISVIPVGESVLAWLPHSSTSLADGYHQPQTALHSNHIRIPSAFDGRLNSFGQYICPIRLPAVAFNREESHDIYYPDVLSFVWFQSPRCPMQAARLPNTFLVSIFLVEASSSSHPANQLIRLPAPSFAPVIKISMSSVHHIDSCEIEAISLQENYKESLKKVVRRWRPMQPTSRPRRSSSSWPPSPITYGPFQRIWNLTSNYPALAPVRGFAGSDLRARPPHCENLMPGVSAPSSRCRRQGNILHT
jgi:hypothetical protein